MKGFSSAARVVALALVATGTLGGCKKADAPLFSPAPGIYISPQLVTMTSATTIDPLPTLPALLTGPQGAGAGKIGMTSSQWLKVAN